jgi:hypothetical protein
VDPRIAEAFALQVERLYARMISAKHWVPPVSILRPGMIAENPNAQQNSEPSLGGKLFYAADLDADARALVIAANIAGAATLTASDDPEVRKQAMRDGVVDFLVTTLDEALRILKNEVRKRETVAVCVTQAPENVEQQMRERGVLSDLQRPIEPAALEPDHCILFWRVAVAPALWLPKIDTLALDCLHENPGAPGLSFETRDPARRWLCLSPRYLGRLTQGARILRCSNLSADSILMQLRDAAESGTIGASVEFKRIDSGQTEQILIVPHNS